MQSVFNVLFIWLFIYLIFINNDNFKINCATLWPGLFAQSVLRTPPFWGSPTPFYPNHPNTASATDDLTNLQQSESNGHLFASAEQHMISSDEPIPSGLFIPIDQLHRELYNAPHLLRKHSSNHYPSYHQFNLNHFHHHPNKKLISSSKHHHFKTYPSKFKQFNKNFYNGNSNKKNNKPKDDFNEKFNYLDDDFYSKQNLFNLNKLNSHLIEFSPDYNQELDFTTNSNTVTGNNKNWHPRLNKQTNDQDQTNSLINTSEEQQDEQDDLFTIHTKNQSNELPILMKNGRIDLRKSNKRKNNLKDHHHLIKDNSKEFKIIKELRDLRNLKETLKDLKELKDNKDQLKPSSINENRYLDNYDNHNNQDNEKLNENRNIEKYNLERFLNQDKLNQKENRNDGRILINQSNQQRKEKSNQQQHHHHHQHENLNNGDLSVISETIYQNHQNLLNKNDNRRSPSRLILMQNYDRHFDVDSDKKQNNNESITILTNDNFISNKTDDQIDSQNNQLNLSKTELPKLISNNKIDLLNNEEQINQQQLYGTTLWNAQRIIPTPQISYMQSMFTESNTLTPSTEQVTKSTYLSERSQLKNNNNNSNHFSTLAISCIIVASLIAAILFTGSSLFLMYKVSQIKKRRLMRFQETASRNQFESSFPVQTNCKSTHTSKNSSLNSGTSSNLLNNNIISNNNFIRQQKSLFSNLNTRCNTNKAILSINEQIDSNFTIKNKNQSNKIATINKKVGKNLNLNHLNLASGSNGDCYVTQIKTSSNEKNSALNRLISKMSNQTNEANDQPINKTNSSDLDQQQQNNQQQNNNNNLPPTQRVSFF